MKKIFITLLILLFIPTICLAGSPKKLAWDANPESDLAGYKVYWAQIDKVSGAWPAAKDIVPLLTNMVDAGTDASGIPNTSWSIHTNVGPVEGKGYCFSVTAYDTSANESGFGEIVCYTETADPVVKDEDPQISSATGTSIIYE